MEHASPNPSIQGTGTSPYSVSYMGGGGGGVIPPINMSPSLVSRLFIACGKSLVKHVFILVPCTKVLAWPIRLQNSAYITGFV